MALRARTRALLPLMILLLQLSVSAKKDPLRSKRVKDGPLGDLLKVDEDDEEHEGSGVLRNHALRHRKVSVKLKQNDEEITEEEEEVSYEARSPAKYVMISLPILSGPSVRGNH